MLKKDQPVTVLANTLDYDSVASRSDVKAGRGCFQGDTSIKADEIVLDDKNGDLSAVGPVTTTTTPRDKPTRTARRSACGRLARRRTSPTRMTTRRLTYTGDAHMNGPQGDMSAAKIELYLKPSGDELERAEAHEKS